MTGTCEFGEVYLCRFPFTSGESSKPRPVLVLFDIGADVVICRITSVMHTSRFDVTILHWQQAGLQRPSVIRLNRLVTAEKSVLLHRLGSLSEPDARVIKAVWNQHMILR
ncbi:MAG: type II toxin-antitoxin system PemK/MazF family toxin [Verrucomicrobia bacterium]|nr:type II toxin-antitoxin system PemK/MazF family toxin [Verrucomicrobiota bacterium]